MILKLWPVRCAAGCTGNACRTSNSKQQQRISTAYVILALLSVLFGLACKSPAGPVPTPEPAEMVAALEVQAERVRTELRSAERLDFPGPTPAPTRTPRPTLDVDQIIAVATVRAMPPTLVAANIQFHSESCVEHYQALLVDHPGDSLYPEDALGIAESLLKTRAECANDGFHPEIDLEIACKGYLVGGVPLPPTLTVGSQIAGNLRAGGTARDSRGNMLVHFRRLPDQAAPGCWYYSANSRTWSWTAVNVGAGLYRPDHSRCDAKLRGLLVSSASNLERVAQIADLVELVRTEDELCGVQGWYPYPAVASVSECGESSSTGWRDEGVLVLNWQENHRPYDQRACWLFDPDLGEKGWTAP